MTYEELFKEYKLLTCPMSPIEHFMVMRGKIWQPKDSISQGRYSIELSLEPFRWGDEEVNTSIKLDFINLKGLPFKELSNKAFPFPINPEDGYIDGSVYLESTHNPIDVTLISFGILYSDLMSEQDLNENYIAVTILYKFCWEGEDPVNYPEIKRVNVVLKYVP
ncbi:MAG: hypothetical protein K0M45_07165 [Candidatus Paracaedibacteraceae bacterium]|nr:hypothetical protein [Candidatus Paracaedibacteraceae bacterium]